MITNVWGDELHIAESLGWHYPPGKHVSDALLRVHNQRTYQAKFMWMDHLKATGGAKEIISAVERAPHVYVNFISQKLAIEEAGRP